MPELRRVVVVPVPRAEVFDHVADPRRWPESFNEIKSVDRVEGWDSPGGRCRLSVNRLGRHAYVDCELVEFDRPHLIRYVARTAGLPELDYRHTFTEVSDGTRVEFSVRRELRGGLGRLLDQTLVRWLAARMWDRATAAIVARLTAGGHRPP